MDIVSSLPGSNLMVEHLASGVTQLMLELTPYVQDYSATILTYLRLFSPFS